ncbi:MAG: hypothetical protein U0326_33135 [Polyangiales bacterium]
MCAAYDFGLARDLQGRVAVAPWKARDGQALLDELAAMYAVGVRAVRWWILAGGATLGRPHHLGASNRLGTPDGLDRRLLAATGGERFYASGAWGFTAPDVGACRSIVDDVVRMLRLVQRFNAETPERARDPLRVLPSWFDFRFFLAPGQLCREWFTPSQNDRANYDLDDLVEQEVWFVDRMFDTLWHVPGGRLDVLLDARLRRAIYARVVIPTLEAVAADEGLRDQVLYWEVGNELDTLMLGSVSRDQTDERGHVGMPRLTRALYRFVSEMILLHRGAQVALPEAGSVRARVRRPFRTTVGWLRWDGPTGLQQSLIARSWLHRHPEVAGPVAVEDVLQFHPYMSMHDDEAPTVLVAPETSRDKLFRPGFARAGERALFTELRPWTTLCGWRLWPMASEVRAFAASAAGADLNALMGFAPGVAVSLDDAHIPCVAGEIHMVAASGNPHEGRSSERWGRHFSVPGLLSPGPLFQARSLAWNEAVSRFEQVPPDGLTAALREEITWAYEPFADTLTGRLCLLHPLGYSWTLPWAWNVGPTERPPEHYLADDERAWLLVSNDESLRARVDDRFRRESAIGFWRRMRLGEQLRAYSDAVGSSEHP